MVAQVFPPRGEERGIRGNGHMVMLEKNNLRVAQLFHHLIQHRIVSAAPSVAAQ